MVASHWTIVSVGPARRHPLTEYVFVKCNVDIRWCICWRVWGSIALVVFRRHTLLGQPACVRFGVSGLRFAWSRFFYCSHRCCLESLHLNSSSKSSSTMATAESSKEITDSRERGRVRSSNGRGETDPSSWVCARRITYPCDKRGCWARVLQPFMLLISFIILNLWKGSQPTDGLFRFLLLWDKNCFDKRSKVGNDFGVDVATGHDEISSWYVAHFAVSHSISS